MGIVIRQSFKSTLFLYIGVLIGLVNRLFLLPYYLTFEQLGLIDIIIGISIIISEISLLGLKGSLQKFFSIFEKNKQLKTLTGITLYLPIISFLIISLTIILCKGTIVSWFPKNETLFSKHYYYLIPFSFFFMYKGILTVFAANKMRLTVPTILNEVFSKISILLSLLLIGYHFIEFDVYILLICISYFLIAFGLYFYNRVFLNMKASTNFSNIDLKSVKQIRTYSLFVLLMGLSNMVSQYTDSFMLGSIEGFNVTGIYSIAFYIGLSIEMPKRAISSISGAIIAKHWNNNEEKEINKLYKQSSINQGIIGAFLFLLVFVCLDELFYILPKSEELSIGKNVALIIGASRLIDMITGINNEILRTSSYYRIDFILILFFIGLSITTNLILIPILGIEGAATATLISVALYNIIRFIILKRLFNFNPFTIETLKLILLLSSLIGVSLLLPNINTNNVFQSIIIIIIKSLIYGGLFILISYKLKLSIEINTLINKIANIIRKKLRV